MILSRELTDDESGILREALCAEATFTTESLPTNADVTVTKLEFDDTVSSSLAQAIESAIDAVKSLPDVGVPGLSVPAQPAEDTAREEATDGVTELVEATVTS